MSDKIGHQDALQALGALVHAAPFSDPVVAAANIVESYITQLETEVGQLQGAINSINPDVLSPMEALTELYRIKRIMAR